jgi:hypothetical protein
MSTNPYESPKIACSPEQPTAPRRNWRDYSPTYNVAFWTALKIQAGLAILTALVLDLGQTHRAFWVAFLCQWAAVWMILFRRPMNPTRLDLAIVRYGIIPLLIIVAGFGPALLDFLGIKP